MNKVAYKKNKKILLLGLNGRGGTLHYASSISSNLSRFTEVSLLLPSYSDSSLISKDVNIIRITAPPNTLKTIFFTFNIFQHITAIKEMNKTNADVLDILDIHPWYVMYWPFLKAKKKIVTINDPELHSGESGWLMTFILRKITRFLLGNADEIIVLGSRQKETVKRLGYKQPIIVSRIGQYDFFTKKTKKKYLVEPNTLLFFGRIKEYKGLKYLLEALDIINDKNIKFKLIIAGEGDIAPYAEMIKRLGDKVEQYIGYISDEKAAEYFQRASFIVMPYTDATQTGVVQVAYSFKKPVIATNVGSLPEVVIDGNTGIIIMSKNVAALSKAIQSLLENQMKAKKFGSNGYRFMKQELNWNSIVKKLLKDIE